jgi:hypothetical protein
MSYFFGMFVTVYKVLLKIFINRQKDKLNDQTKGKLQ